MTPLSDRIGLHAWTLDTTPIEDVLRIARETGYAAVELRFIDYKRALDRGMSREQYLELVRSSGIPVCVMGVENGLVFAQGAERERLMESFDTSCANAIAVGCRTLMISPGQNPHRSAKDAGDNLHMAGWVAERHGVSLALEFSSGHPMLNNLATAREIVAAAKRPNVGLLLDAYHMQATGSGGRAFEDVPVEQILAFQFSDVPRDVKLGAGSPLDRLPPGQGSVQWHDMFALLMEKQYSGCIVYEAPNPTQWSRAPEAVAREGIEATRALIAAAREHVNGRH
jgi:sugar phosphate isomerase/epimerase